MGVHFIYVSSSWTLDPGLCGEPERSSNVSAANKCWCAGRAGRPLAGEPASTFCAQACFRDAVNDSIAGAHYADISNHKGRLTKTNMVCCSLQSSLYFNFMRCLRMAMRESLAEAQEEIQERSMHTEHVTRTTSL